ncbi:MAG: hypothetical protein ACREFU_02275 [Acetobacteraceae bacterium]
MDREELLAELARVLSRTFLAVARDRSTTEQLRETVAGVRAEIALLERMGLKDQGAPRQG